MDLNGKPDAGWLLYLYTANSSTPVNSYQDTALTVLNTWPIAADSNGMMGAFWLADGSYRARATNRDGSRTFFDLTSVLAIGASAGAAPSGGVDATAIYQTGDIKPLDFQGTVSGWVRNNGRTIGSATSGSTERANADTQALFTWLWTNFNDARCPVLTGRGASAAADWAANKQITLPDYRGKSFIGLDDMGTTAAGRFTGVPFTVGNATTAGSLGGEVSHALTTAESPIHQHDVFIFDPTHFHQESPQYGAAGFGVNANVGATSGSIQNTSAASTGITIGSVNGVANDNKTASAGGGGAHNNVPPMFTGSWYRKL